MGYNTVVIKSFRDLEIYQESLKLAKDIHYLVKKYPAREMYLLVDQSLRASRSVPSLISEGWAKRRQVKSFQKYLRDAVGECNEMMNHVEQAELFGYMPKRQAKDLIERYDRLASRIHKLKDNWQNFKP